MGNILARRIAAAMDLDSADSEPKRVTVHNTAGLSLCFWVNGGGPFYSSGVANSASFALPRHIAITSSLKLQATVVVDGDGTSFRLANWDLPADRFRSSLSLTLDPMLEGLPMSTVKLLVSVQRGVRRRRARKEAERIAAEKERKRRAAEAIEKFARGYLARSTRPRSTRCYS